MFGKRSKPQGTGQQWREPTATPPAPSSGGEDTDKAEQPAAAQPVQPASKPDAAAVLKRQPASPLGSNRTQRGRTEREGGSKKDEPQDDNTVFIGRNIHMSGTIAACDRVTVEGTVEADLTRTRELSVAPSGEVTGSAVVDVAEIAGSFDGDLVVRDRLNLRATGRVHGTIRYRGLEIESGGRIGGSLIELTAEDADGYRTTSDAAGEAAESATESASE